MYLLCATTNRYQGGFPPAPILLVTLMPASLLTGNTAMIEARTHNESVIRHEPILDGIQNTSNTEPEVIPLCSTHTDAGPPNISRVRDSAYPFSDSFEARSAIHEIKRLSGLTWEDLAGILSVTRRSLHLWANGGPINTPNEKLVRDVLMTMRAMDRGTATENRRLLLTPLADGRVFTDLLRNRKFDEAAAFAGQGNARTVPIRTLAPKANPEGRGLSVADMLGTNSERIHTDRGRVLPSRRHSA